MIFTRMHWLSVVVGLASIGTSYFYFFAEQRSLFWFITSISIAIMLAPFLLSLLLRDQRDEMIANMFLEFSRGLAESVGTGTPVSKSIVQLSKKNYGVLTEYIVKLGNQISLGIPLQTALETFARDVNSPVVTRAVGLMSEAERAGGEIDAILDSLAVSLAEIEKLKKERKAAISSLIVQGYIIFFIFIGIMLVMKFKILPLAIGLGNFGSLGALDQPFSSTGSKTLLDTCSIGNLFLYLLLAQGLFAGIIIGKLSEGSVRAGLKHSIILIIGALLISTGADYFIPTVGCT